MDESLKLEEHVNKVTKMSTLEKSWIAYDVGNSAFVLLVTTILPLYFNSLAESAHIASSDYLAYWGYAQSVTTFLVILLGPILGAWADGSGSKKQIFLATVIFGIMTMLALALPLSWFTFLVFLVIARVGFQASLIFYDAMLTDISAGARMDTLSSFGFAFGYIGSVIPFVLSLLFVLGNEVIGISMKTAMGIAIVINAIWWFLFTIPLLKNYKQPSYEEERDSRVTNVFSRLGHTLAEVFRDKKVFLFLLAFFFYIDGVSTIISMAVSYGGSLGLDSSSLLLALLATQIVAFPFSILFGYLAKKYRSTTLIQICIVGYTLITLFAVQLDQEWEFWLLAILVGMFQGGIQALSRSYFGKLIPKHKSSEYFSLYDIFAKGAALTGTTLVAVISQVTGRQQLGILALVILFILGFFFFRASVKVE